MHTVYTSCAANYAAKAAALAQSVREHSPDVWLLLLLCDDTDLVPASLLKDFDEVLTPWDLGYQAPWVFQHNVMELCTAVKGRGAVHALASGAEVCVYLDPDVYAYQPIQDLVDLLGEDSIGLVPHMTRPAVSRLEVMVTELSIMEHGAFNLGHLLLRNDDIGRQVAQWWAARLDDYCYDDRRYGLFTDQRWMDVVPAFFSGVRIIKHPGVDAASWNISGKTIAQSQGQWTIDGEKLLTYHFSGADHREVHSDVRSMLFPDSPNAIVLEKAYRAKLVSLGQDAMASVPFSLDSFRSGRPVSKGARVLYRLAPDLPAAFPDPFASGENSYEDWLLSNRPDLVPGQSLAHEDVDRAWNELFDGDYYTEELARINIALPTGVSPEKHYRAVGWRLGADPCRFFLTAYYRRKLSAAHVSDAARVDWLTHYLAVGLREGVQPLPGFMPDWYLSNNEDVRQAVLTRVYLTPLAHFASAGAHEGRAPGPSFDAAAQFERDPELARMVRDREVATAFEGYLERWRRRHIDLAELR